MALRPHVVPNMFEVTVGTDQKSTADNAEERPAEEFLHAARAVGFNRF